MDDSKEHAIRVMLPNGNTLVFNECNDGLYHLNIRNINKDIMYYSCLKTFNKIILILHIGKLAYFYNSKLDSQVKLLSNPSLPMI